MAITKPLAASALALKPLGFGISAALTAADTAIKITGSEPSKKTKKKEEKKSEDALLYDILADTGAVSAEDSEKRAQLAREKEKEKETESAQNITPLAPNALGSAYIIPGSRITAAPNNSNSKSKKTKSDKKETKAAFDAGASAAAMGGGGIVYIPKNEEYPEIPSHKEKPKPTAETQKAIDITSSYGFTGMGEAYQMYGKTEYDEAKKEYDEAWQNKQNAYNENKEKELFELSNTAPSENLDNFDVKKIPTGINTNIIKYALDEDFRRRLDLENAKFGLVDSPFENLKYLNDEELYIIENLSAYGDYDAALRYIELKTPELNERMQSELSKNMESMAKEHPVAGTIVNLVSSNDTVASLVPLMDSAIAERKGEYKPIDTNSIAFRGIHNMTDTRKGIGDAAYEAAGGGDAGEIARAVSGAFLDVAGYAVKTGLGGAGVALNAAASGTNVMFDVVEKGGSASSALMAGTTAALLEAVPGAIGAKNFFRLTLSNKRGAAALFKRIATQAGYNSMEGAVSTATNNLVDNISNADNSHLNETKQAYMQQGFSENDAESKAMMDCFVIEPALSSAIGLAVGAVSGAGTIKYAINYKPSTGIKLKPNPSKTTTVIGKYTEDTYHIINELDMPKSTYFGERKGDFNLLNMPDGYYKEASQFWEEYNRPWLDEAIKRGDDILVATPLIEDYLKDRNGNLTGFGREVEYLIEHGYEYRNGKMIKVK